VRLVLKKGGFNRFCSKSCASSGENNAMGRLKGENSPNFGKKRTEAQRLNYSEGARKRWDVHGDKLRAMMQTPEYRKANSDSQRESYINDSTLRDRKREAMHRFWSSDSPLTHQRRREASDRAIVLLEQNKIGPQAPFKQMWVDNPFTGKPEYMHSSWETAFLMTCVRNGYPVTKDHGIVVDYRQADGSRHRYVPDFKSLEENVLFEVKGNMTPNDELKIRAAELAGYEVVLVGDS